MNQVKLLSTIFGLIVTLAAPALWACDKHPSSDDEKPETTEQVQSSH